MLNKILWIAFGVALALCLCMSTAAFFTLRSVGERMTDTIKLEPAEAEQVGAQIAGYDVPAGYSHRMAMSAMEYDFVIIAPEDDTPGMMILLAQFGQGLAQNPDSKIFQEQMQRSIEQRSGRRGLNLKAIETRSMTIRGQEVKVTLFEGADQNGISIRQMVASFPAENGLGMVLIQGAADGWDQSTADAFLESIR
jgi:hypothetical protein